MTCMFKLVCVDIFYACVSLLRGKYRDHIVPLRVNIPSQVPNLLRERESRKRRRRKINIKDKKGEKGSWRTEKKGGAKKMCDLKSRGTRAQTQIKEHQTKEIRKGQKAEKEGLGHGEVTSIKPKLQSINDDQIK